jgi:hypothetical protein
MQTQIDDMKEEQSRQGKMITEMHNALVGTEYTHGRGMIDAVQQNTKFRRNSGWWATFFMSVGTFFGAFLQWLKIKMFGV